MMAVCFGVSCRACTVQDTRAATCWAASGSGDSESRLVMFIVSTMCSRPIKMSDTDACSTLHQKQSQKSGNIDSASSSRSRSKDSTHGQSTQHQHGRQTERQATKVFLSK